MSETPDLFLSPDFCPACSGTLVEEGDFLFCRNRGCPVQLSGSVKVWIKRLGLLHWGDAMVDALTDPNKLRIISIGDIYRLDVDTLAECCSGKKMAQKCYDVLHANKQISLELLIASLNIPNLAVATATDIVQAGFDTVEKVLDLTYEDLLKIPNIGEKTARQVFDGLKEKRSVIVDLSSVLDVRPPVTGPLSGMSFCITGATRKTRKAVQKDIMDAGGVVKESVGKGLTHLVTNEDQSFGSSKMKKAEKYGTKIITEVELYQLIGVTVSDAASSAQEEPEIGELGVFSASGPGDGTSPL